MQGRLVKWRMELAEIYCKKQSYPEAIKLFLECIDGIEANESNLATVAKIYLEIVRLNSLTNNLKEA